MSNVSLFGLLLLPGCAGDKATEGDEGGGAEEDADQDGYTSGEDCDDADATVHPGAEELACDGLDNDCAGGDLTDGDGDGFLCEDAQDGDDCDDGDATVHPGATDTCGDRIDSDCGGEIECDCDDDGYDGEQCDGSDCDDADAGINPDAEDTCYDGIDHDCLEFDDYDCDRDGYVSADYGGDDCEDGDYRLNPGEAEVCQDGQDNDCNAATVDCDCDGDGVEAADCGGGDCDDEDATVAPGADESTVDGEDNDCDEAVDEDAYCNVWFPLSNGSSAARTYNTLFIDGSTYTETVLISDYDATTGEATVNRSLSSALGSWSFDEYVSCIDGQVEQDGVAITAFGLSLANGTYTASHVLFPPEGEIVEGLSWSYAYDAVDAGTGSLLWSSSGTTTVLGMAEVTVEAGTFTALVLENDYVVVDTFLGGALSREGIVTTWHVPRLGLVYSEDIRDDGSTAETRELATYDGFYP